jgi:hypothetical protein
LQRLPLVTPGPLNVPPGGDADSVIDAPLEQIVLGKEKVKVGLGFTTTTTESVE